MQRMPNHGGGPSFHGLSDIRHTPLDQAFTLLDSGWHYWINPHEVRQSREQGGCNCVEILAGPRSGSDNLIWFKLENGKRSLGDRRRGGFKSGILTAPCYYGYLPFSAFLGLLLFISLVSSLENCVHWSGSSDFVPEISSGDVSMKTIITIGSTGRRMKMYENNIWFSCFS